jgi:hypothetical protein
MTNLELLQSRVIELITEQLNDAILPDDKDDYRRAKARYYLAISWETHSESILGLFQDLYFQSVVGLIDRVDQLIPYEEEDIGCSAEDLLTDFEAIRDITENSFIAPVILLSASLLNWPLIGSKCIDLLFHPKLMGGFTRIDDAILHFEGEYEWQRDLAIGNDELDLFDEI